MSIHQTALMNYNGRTGAKQQRPSDGKELDLSGVVSHEDNVLQAGWPRGEMRRMPKGTNSRRSDGGNLRGNRDHLKSTNRRQLTGFALPMHGVGFYISRDHRTHMPLSSAVADLLTAAVGRAGVVALERRPTLFTRPGDRG